MDYNHWTAGITYEQAIKAFQRVNACWSSYGVKYAAVGNPKEKIRIEPVEDPVPSKTPAPTEAPQPVEAPVETPVGV